MSAGSPIRIGMLLDHPFPPDPRVAQEGRSLVEDGQEVHLFCVDWAGQPKRERVDGIEVHRYSMSKTFHNKAGALSLTLPLYTAWFRRRLASFLKQHRIEALHIHDLPLAAVGWQAARAHGIPLILDLHENYPAALRTYGYARSFLGRLLIWPSAWERFEKRMVHSADHIVVVIEEARDRIMSLAVPNERISVVPNTVDLETFLKFSLDAELISRMPADRYRILYTGGFDEHRGLDTAVKAMALAVHGEETSKVHLEMTLVGTGRNRAALERLAENLSVADHLRFEGWQPYTTFPSYIAASHVGLIPHLKTPHTDSTIPHKLFHYMCLGRPVIVTNCRPLERIVKETGAGLVVPHSHPEAMASAIHKLKDPALRKEMGERGRKAVQEHYHWSRTIDPLLQLYRKIALKRNPREPVL
ncbi:MAG: glycosyltransferase family 4 protein [Candidatus Eisenbacteria bacterium]|uniref:Glycosyltransferase family 4 protein n=1 Tax=Eiseniibacteriota bacterium TaxID=2212470 RepID=A0A948RVR4_UNCEI|nr:glycosyltransferase family 4 protein [Candidatus Eisenbacteria bacterium]MBU1948752.1 glycosyltransferase family 4 protein [Candidatus Eisenbacteria bacterium]MBU2690463.1 glycosyltransferase family 4 protein [Candidatus Eisenbacteria bacterium]